MFAIANPRPALQTAPPNDTLCHPHVQAVPTFPEAKTTRTIDRKTHVVSTACATRAALKAPPGALAFPHGCGGLRVSGRGSGCAPRSPEPSRAQCLQCPGQRAGDPCSLPVLCFRCIRPSPPPLPPPASGPVRMTRSGRCLPASHSAIPQSSRLSHAAMPTEAQQNGHGSWPKINNARHTPDVRSNSTKPPPKGLL